MFSRSLQAKFILPVSVLVVVTLILVAAISISNSRSIEQSAQNESQEKLSNIVQILSITDATMSEQNAIAIQDVANASAQLRESADSLQAAVAQFRIINLS